MCETPHPQRLFALWSHHPSGTLRRRVALVIARGARSVGKQGRFGRAHQHIS